MRYARVSEQLAPVRIEKRLVTGQDGYKEPLRVLGKHGVLYGRHKPLTQVMEESRNSCGMPRYAKRI